ncbi:MAG: EAL domain-containing protein [Pseudomonadota bacterium]|nr:EAL domain-containing protein [Pseudomonadota bacterium]MDO7667650.1 EAL domain-containing protein [Pseudomonadota bacterium]MDO7710455.1 EAL domain-containing protein [Pseudomonadota bacterium]
MSLSKQLLLLISLIFFIVFSVNFVLSMGNIKSYLEVESEIHVQDTATSLGLSISPYMSNEDDPIIRTMMNAIFDMGYYKEMSLVDVDGKALVTLTSAEEIAGVPSWLVSLMPMKVTTAVSEISSGWNISGTLSVTTNPGYGYLKLYQQGKTTLKFSFIIFLIAISLLALTLRFTLRPLRAIEKQANDISAGNFTVIENLPWTLEVKNVAQSMNIMSLKIGSIIARLNSKLASLSENLKRDPLTKLLNQATFYVNLKEILSMGQSGYAAIIKFDDLASIAKNHGNDAVNQLLIKFAQILDQVQQSEPRSSTYRLYGSEFALLCPTLNKDEIIELADSLKVAIAELGQQYYIDDLVHIGIIRFERSSDFNKLSPAMIEAYEQARKIGHNAYFIQEESMSSMSELDWKATINNVIDNNMPEIMLTSDAYNYDGENPVKVMEEAFTLVKDSTGNSLAIGTFFSMAQEFGLEEELDKCIVNKIILLMEQTQQSVPVTINLSMTAVSSSSFCAWLQARIEITMLSPGLLVFSVTAYSAAKDLTAFANFSLFVKALGAKTLLKRYSSDIIAINLLKELHIDYIRLARNLTQDIQADSNKSDLLDIMHEVSSLLDINVIAEGVSQENDFEFVKKSGIYGIGR